MSNPTGNALASHAKVTSTTSHSSSGQSTEAIIASVKQLVRRHLQKVLAVQRTR